MPGQLVHLMAMMNLITRIRTLWYGLLLMICSAVVFAVMVMVGYVVQAWYPRSRLAWYFNETDLFTLWIVSMLCGMGLAVLLFLTVLDTVAFQDPVLGGSLMVLGVGGLLSPVAGVAGLVHWHHKRKQLPAAAHHHIGHLGVSQPSRPARTRTLAAAPAAKRTAAKKAGGKSKR